MTSEFDLLMLEIDKAKDKVPIGSIWRHLKTETLYMIKDLVVRESDLTICVSYQKLMIGSQVHWIRPLDEFLDGRFVKL